MTFARKKEPPASLHLLVHPEQDSEYRHFEVALADGSFAQAVRALPFDTAATTFSPINAWWLADAALLAYWDQAEATKRFKSDAGLNSTFFSRNGTQCYVASNDQFVVVAFRGTQPNDRADVWTDADFVPRPWERGGQAHEGFIRGLNVVWADLLTELKAMDGKGVWFTGHSLGAALAVLAADRFGSPAGVYTIGSPRVGDSAFAAGFNGRHAGRSFRYVNYHDVVTHVPPSDFGFCHVDAEKHFDETGVLQGRAASGQGVIDGASKFFAGLPKLVSGASLMPRALIDHTPRRYTTCIWNAFVASDSVRT